MGLNLDALDEDTRSKIMNLNNLQQTLEFLTSQKVQTETNLQEGQLAVEELEKLAEDAVVYKSIGGLMVKGDRNKILDEKKSENVTMEMRLKTLDSKINRTRQNLQNLQKSIQAELQKKQQA